MSVESNIEAKQNEPRLVEEIPGMMKVFDDGSIRRIDHPLMINIHPSDNPGPEDDGVGRRDVDIKKEDGIWVRIYLPIACMASKLPVLLYFHGGGFCFLSAAFLASHRFCLKLAATIGAIVVSVNHRLAPEHRLPAAYDDAMEVIEWLQSPRSHADPWLHAYADFRNVFLVGESSGGNIVHHLLIRTASAMIGDHKASSEDGFCIRGAVLLQPFFGGEERTRSEIVCPPDVEVNVEVCDKLWRLALPMGISRDHPFSNPVKYLKLGLPLPPILVVLGTNDCLCDRGLEFYEAIQNSAKCSRLDLLVFEGEKHGFFHADLMEEGNEAAFNVNFSRLMCHAALFVSSNCSN